MPLINTFDPASAASDALGSYFGQRRQNALDAAAQAAQSAAGARADKQIGIEQQNADLGQKRFEHETHEDTVHDALDQAAQVVTARKNAEDALHQARVDALDRAKETDARVKNDRAYALSVKQINEKFAEKQADLKNARTVADIRATATLGAAQIHAAAQVQAAGIGASSRIEAAGITQGGADERETRREKFQAGLFTNRDATVRRGQDLNALTAAVREGRAPVRYSTLAPLAMHEINAP